MRSIICGALFLVLAVLLGCQKLTPTSSSPTDQSSKPDKGSGGQAKREVAPVPPVDADADEKLAADLKLKGVDIRPSRISSGFVVQIKADDLTPTGEIKPAYKELRKVPSNKDIELSFHHCQVTEAGLAEIAKYGQVKSLVLISTPQIRRFDALEKSSWLRSLTLQDVPVTDEGLAAVSKLKKLEHLHLRQLAITDAGLNSMKGLTHLKTVEISNCRGVTQKGVDQLQKVLHKAAIAFRN